jgi:hypothetical protein
MKPLGIKGLFLLVALSLMIMLLSGETRTEKRIDV